MGDLFLDAAKKRTQLNKGFPLHGKGTVRPRDLDRALYDPTYRVNDSLDAAVKRLRATSPDDLPTGSQYETTRDRLEVEQSEGINRNKPEVTKAGLPRKGRR